LSHSFVSKLETADCKIMVLPLSGMEDGMRTITMYWMLKPVRTAMLVRLRNPSYKRMYFAPVIRDLSTSHMSCTSADSLKVCMQRICDSSIIRQE